MTIQQLIEQLQKVENKQLPVVIETFDQDGCFDGHQSVRETKQIVTNDLDGKIDFSRDITCLLIS